MFELKVMDTAKTRPDRYSWMRNIGEETGKGGNLQPERKRPTAIADLVGDKEGLTVHQCTIVYDALKII